MAQNQTLLAVVALVNGDAAKHAAFESLERGIRSFVVHGTKNPLADTRDALATLSQTAAVKRVASMVASAYSMADVEFGTHKRANPDAPAAVARILAACIAEFDASEAAAKAAKAAKAAEVKAAKEKAERAMKRAAQSVAPLKQALSVADAADVLRRMAEAGDEQALTAIAALAETFYTVGTAEA